MNAAATNLRTIVEIERQSQENRSRIQVFTDDITAIASSFRFIVVHIVWFFVWIGFNALSSHPFDAFPFNGQVDRRRVARIGGDAEALIGRVQERYSHCLSSWV